MPIDIINITHQTGGMVTNDTESIYFDLLNV